MSSSPAVLVPCHLDGFPGRVVSGPGAVPAGLLDALSQVPDPRDPRGVRYDFVSVQAVAVCATLAGARSYTAMAEWASDAPRGLRAEQGLPGPVPGLATIWRVLTAVDPLAPDMVIGARVAARLAGGQAPAVLAAGGKTLRGARAGSGRAPHLMACPGHGAGVVRARVAVDGKSSEIPLSGPLLDQIEDLDGVLITADAMHAQREHAICLHKRGGHFILTVKGRQPGLHRQLRALPWKDVPAGHARAGRARGRIEKRALKAVTVTAGLLFPHAQQAIQITRRTLASPAGNGVPRPAARSPRCPPARPGPISSPPGSAATGRSRTSFTGPRRHLRRRPPHRAHWQRAPRHGQPAHSLT
ncbi:MAG: ISAs1 family transposase [Streptosporangiaceae bacterium]